MHGLSGRGRLVRPGQRALPWQRLQDRVRFLKDWELACRPGRLLAADAEGRGIGR